MRYFFLCLLGVVEGLYAQVLPTAQDSIIVDGGGKDSLKVFRPKISDFRYTQEERNWKVIDTTFSLDKSFALVNYAHRDPFYRSPFSNIGAGFQSLRPVIDANTENRLLPENKSWLYIPAEEVRYYDVKVPTTSFTFNNGVKNGAALLSTYTQNFGKNLNIAATYFGLRSQGAYRDDLSANNYLLISTRYENPKWNYSLLAHFYNYNNNRQENGGIISLENYYNDDRFRNRLNLETRLTGATSLYRARRLYLSHRWVPFSSGAFQGGFRHRLSYMTVNYAFNETTPDPEFFNIQEEPVTSYLHSKKYFKNLRNDVLASFNWRGLDIEAGLRLDRVKMGVENPMQLNPGTLDGLYQDSRLGAVGKVSWKGRNDWNAQSEFSFTTGKLLGTDLRSTTQIHGEVFNNVLFSGNLVYTSAKPDVNWLINTSPYSQLAYNNLSAKNQNLLQVDAKIHLPWFASIVGLSYVNAQNYAYYGLNGAPMQAEKGFSTTEVFGEGTWGYGKFFANARASFRPMHTGKDLLPLPYFIIRGMVYYESDLFAKALRLRTGIRGWYFSAFDSRNFLPHLNEFVLAGTTTYPIGNHPVIDVFAHAKVKTMLIFLEAQHVNAAFMKNKAFAAPYFPSSDFRLNLGFQWRLFH